MCGFPRDKPGGAKCVCAAFSKSAVWGAGAHSEVLGSDRRPGRACAVLGRFNWDWLAHTRTHFTKGNSECEGDRGFPGHSGMGRRRVSATRPEPHFTEPALRAGEGFALCASAFNDTTGICRWSCTVEHFNPWGNAQHLSLVHGCYKTFAGIPGCTQKGADAATLSPFPILRVPKQPVALSRALRQYPVRCGQARVYCWTWSVWLQRREGGI